MPIRGIDDLERGGAPLRGRGARDSAADGPGEEREELYSLLSLGTIPGELPYLSDFLAPRASWVTFVGVVSALQALLFAVTLVVAGVRAPHVVMDSGNATGGPPPATLRYMGAKDRALIRAGQLHRLVMPVLLHAGVLHILGNLLIQVRFGFSLERRWGSRAFAAVYAVSGLGGVLLSCVASPDDLSVGASGAIMGMLGADLAFCAYNYKAEPLLRQEAAVVAFLAVMNMLVGLATPHTDNWAHLGGLALGALCGVALVRHRERRPAERTFRLVAGAALSAAMVGMAVSVFA